MSIIKEQGNEYIRDLREPHNRCGYARGSITDETGEEFNARYGRREGR
jgi:hypothetical protein